MFPFMNIDFSSIFDDPNELEFSERFELATEVSLPETDSSLIKGTI